nr:MAG TPA: hypothetical protein [Caudoviricetes sp.]
MCFVADLSISANRSILVIAPLLYDIIVILCFEECRPLCRSFLVQETLRGFI